jgi:N-acyl homoserine lactone hydrolase
VIVGVGERTYFLAGDTSYLEATMREGVVDAVVPTTRVYMDTLAKVRSFVDQNNAVYLPSHDPESVARLEAAQQA